LPEYEKQQTFPNRPRSWNEISNHDFKGC